jgi:LmbE family N-acetylglucosaminyl deacetylase
MTPKPTRELFEYDGSFKRALVVVAHPDDVDFGFAGTVATLTTLGVDVAYCLVTSGDAGGDDSSHSKEERTAIREAEQTAAAKEVGVSDLSFLRFPDGLVEVTLLLRREISRTIRTYKPDLVITQSPERNYDRIRASHPDHLAAGEAALRAVYPDSRNPHAFPELLREGLAPHTVDTVWLGGSNPDMVVDVTEQFSRKIAALKRHVSQVGDGDGLEDRLKEWLKRTAKESGLPKGRLAEAYRRITTA